MRDVPLLPQVHLFVCGNRREADSPLGPGCAAGGDVVYDACKEEVAKRGAVRSVWVTKTHCLGICPRHGCTVAMYLPKTQGNAGAARLWADVTPQDVPALFANALPGKP